MEYPTLITAGTRDGLPEGVKMVEEVIIHEFGHNHWYYLMASNVFAESWLDEDITFYAEIQIIRDYYGEQANLLAYFGIQMDILQFHRARYRSGPDYDPVVQKAWEFYSPTSYGINSYSKPALLLTTLHNDLSHETMRQIMRTDLQRFRFKHPTTWDFIAVASEVVNEDLRWFFDQALYYNAVLDHSVAYVRSKKMKKPKGYDFTREIPVKTRSPLIPRPVTAGIHSRYHRGSPNLVRYGSSGTTVGRFCIPCGSGNGICRWGTPSGEMGWRGALEKIPLYPSGTFNLCHGGTRSKDSPRCQFHQQQPDRKTPVHGIIQDNGALPVLECNFYWNNRIF